MTVRGCFRAGTRGALGGVLLLALAAGGSLPVAAQYIDFGKNKVSYREFDWSVLKSEHCHLYYYHEEEQLARIALAMAEEGYRLHRDRFAHELSRPIPILLYSSHQDFEQTHVTPMFLPEGVGGLTESMRGRVLMPFEGSLYEFRQTLRHELVHAFQLSLSERFVRERGRPRAAAPELWFSEGLAEHWSRTWDADGDLILRDLVISGKLPAIDEFWQYEGTFALYKLGQSVLDFVGETYGDDKLLLFYSEAWKERSFADLLAATLGVERDELSARWTQWLRRRYYPEVAAARPVNEIGERIAIHGQELKPTPIPAGIPGWSGQFVFVSPYSGYVNLYVADLDSKHPHPRVLVKGERSPQLLSFHAFRSRMDVSRQGVLIFSAQAGGEDELTAYDLARQRVVARWGFDSLVGMTSPQWDADGRRVVFSGLGRDARSDLYLLDTETCELRRLTDDLFADTDPAFHPDGRHVAFVSDRGAGGDAGSRNLFLLDLDSGEISRLTEGPWWDLSPSWSPDGEELLFVSTRDGLRDLYTLDRCGRGARRTRSLDAILDPRWLPSGGEVLASVYREGHFETTRIPLRAVAAVDSFQETIAPIVRERLGPVMPAEITARPEPYRPVFALDAAQGGVAVDPSLGNGEGLQVLLRDMLGNRMLFLQLGNTTISTRDFLDNFSAGATWIELGRRVNRGVSLYHHAGDYYDEFGLPYFERRVGASGLLSYPLSRFTRLETSGGLAYAEKEKPSTNVVRRGMIATHYVSWVHDTSLWTETGPIDGTRAHLTLGMTMNLRRPGIENVLLLADGRRYLRFERHSALALRVQARLSGGPDPQVFLLGGAHTLRGYPWRELHGTRSALANAELRFPLLRRFVLDTAWAGPLALPGIQGALFCDAGQAWYRDWPLRWLGSYGFGLRMGLGGVLVLRFDVARRTDFHEWPQRTVSEFFIGWNY